MLVNSRTRTRVHRSCAPAAAGVVALTTLAGCSWLDASTSAAEELTASFEERFGEHLDRIETESPSGLWGGGGWLYATAWFAPDTPEDVLQEALENLQSFDPEHVSMYPAGVVANGVGLCTGDPQLEGKRRLRSALAEQGISLEGVWACAMRPDSAPAPYRGSWQSLTEDTAVLHDLTAPIALTLTAEITDPTSSVNGPWDELSVAEASDALAEIADTLVVDSAVLEPGALLVRVQPTSEVDTAQSAAQRVAGDELEVTVLNGTGAGGAAGGQAVGPMLDAVRELPGVVGVSDTSTGLVVTVADAVTVGDVLSTAAAFDAYAPTAIRVQVAGNNGATQHHRVDKPGGVDGSDVDTFLALAAIPDIAAVWWTVPGLGGHPATTLVLSEPGYAWVTAAKPLLPHGTRVGISGLHQTITVTFTAAPTLTTDDVDLGPADFDPAELIRTWNDGPQ